MGRIVIEGRGADELMRNIGPILKVISSYQHTLRSLRIIPTWYNFINHEAWPKLSRNWSTREKSQFQAWWSGIHHHTRDKKDMQSISLFIAYVLQERVRRDHGVTPPVFPEKYGITDAQHAGRIQEYVRSHYQSLDPSKGIEPNQQN